MKKLRRIYKSRDIVDDPKTFEIAIYCYFGMSDIAILRGMRGMNQGKIQYRIKVARERYHINIKRSDYRNGKNKLARKVISQFRSFAEERLQIADLK